MTTRIRSLFALALACSAATASAQPASDARLRAIDDSVRTLIPAGAPGVAVGVISAGAEHRFFAGEADLSHPSSVGPSTRFNIASNAKQYTAAIALSLVMDGRLDLAADVRRYVPGALPAIRDTIRVRDLLTHTSGLRDVYDLWSLGGQTWWQLFVGNRAALTLLDGQAALNFAPRSQYLYSNSNYLLLTRVVAEVTDSTFAAVSAARFRQWGLGATAFQSDYLDVIPGRARSYGYFNRAWKEYPSITQLHGDGGLFTTLADQLAWERRVMSAADGSLERISQEAVAGAATTAYGYGIERGTYKGEPYHFHDGSTGAYNATFLRFPRQRVAVVVMSNNGTIGVRNLAFQYVDAALGRVIAARVANPTRPARIEPARDIAPWLGDYRASSGTLISLVRTDSGLARVINGQRVQLIAEEGSLYRYATNPNLKLALSNDSAGAPIFTIYAATQAPIVGRRLPESATRVTLADVFGRYRNEETGAELVLQADTSGALAATLNGRPARVERFRADLWLIDGYEVAPAADALDANGRVEALMLDGGRVKRVRFNRVERSP